MSYPFLPVPFFFIASQHWVSHKCTAWRSQETEGVEGASPCSLIIARSSIFSAPYLGGPAHITSRRASGYRMINPRLITGQPACARGILHRHWIKSPSGCVQVSCTTQCAPQGGTTSSWAVLPSSSCKGKVNLGFKTAGVPGDRSQPHTPTWRATHCSQGLSPAGEHRAPCSLPALQTAGSGSFALRLSINKFHQASAFVKSGCVTLFGKYFGARSEDTI